jgi:N utilization substance protein B
MGRRLAREFALKILYRYEAGDRDLPGVCSAVLEAKKYSLEDTRFCRELVNKTVDRLDEIDHAIMAVLKNWEYDRISVIDRIILRLGTCEMLFFEDIPAQVSINEAIELGKRYGGSESGRFINGVLDAIRKKYESSNTE